MTAFTPETGPAHSPYRDAVRDDLYNRCFCDRPRDFAAAPGAAPAPWQTALCDTPPDLAAAAALAADPQAEARVRALACHVLRAHGRGVPPGTLLGVVVEVPMAGSLDTLAAYADGGVRLLHHAGAVHLLEPMPATEQHVAALLRAAGRVVRQIGPMEGPRLPEPGPGEVRLSFLVSDGLYFGQGGLSVMQRDALAGPVLGTAGELLQQVFALAQRRAA